jgi:predicted O-methyltransferase YrrM
MSYPTKAHELGGAFGFLYQDEITFLKQLVKDLPWGANVVNFGAGVGTSSLAMKEERNDLRLSTIDISQGGPYGGLENERNAFRNAGMIDQLPTQILGDSSEQGRRWPGKVWLVFVDGDHSEKSVIADIEAWLPKVLDGGIMAFHDYHSINWPDVKRVVDEKMKPYELIEVRETIAAYRIKREK